MPHSYTQNYIHVIFSTKNRQKLIPEQFQSKLFPYITGICNNLAIHLHAVGGIEDHIHLLIRVPATIPIAKAIATIKSNSSRWTRDQSLPLTWQQGYAAFSVSTSLIPSVTKYIQNQKSHHRKMTFESEFLALLKKHSIPYDPKFTFD